MPLTWDEYKQLKSFGELYSGGLDSAAVAILMGEIIPGDVHLLVPPRLPALFNEWSVATMKTCGACSATGSTTIWWT